MRAEQKKIREYDDEFSKEEDIYTDGFAEELLENDAVSAEEAAFIKGYGEV